MGILGADIAPITAGVAGQEVEEADLMLFQQIKHTGCGGQLAEGEAGMAGFGLACRR